jgi:hypothetical protein
LKFNSLSLKLSWRNERKRVSGVDTEIRTIKVRLRRWRGGKFLRFSSKNWTKLTPKLVMVARDVVVNYHSDPFQSGFDSQRRHKKLWIESFGGLIPPK